MKIVMTPIAGVQVVELQPRQDSRGSFARVFCHRELSSLLGHRQIVQVNHSETRHAGSIRGLHYQLPPAAEMKLVRCIRGSVFDVAVDLRAGSATFMQHHTELLSEGNWKMMVVPEGCAHGFQALEQDSELLYFHTQFYTPELEGGISFCDSRLAIDWPLPPADVSQRDRNHSEIDDTFSGVVIGETD